MKNTSPFKVITLLFSWLIFPPLFFILSIRWKIINPFFRILWSILSPVTLVFVLILYIWGSSYYYFNIKRGSKSEIEGRTQVKFPEFVQIPEDGDTYRPTFNGDFTKVKYYQLDTTDIQTFYVTLEQMVDSCSSHQDQFHNKTWNKDRNGFNFSVVEGDEFLNLKIDKTSCKMEVIFGEM